METAPQHLLSLLLFFSVWNGILEFPSVQILGEVEPPLLPR
jgi:hypothetical protein